MQTTYFSSTGSRVLGTLVALVVLGIVVFLVNRAGRPFKNRYSSRLTEAFQAGLVAVWLILTVVWFTVVWNITWALDIVVNTLSIDRLTAVRTLFTVTAIIVAYLFVRLLNRSIDRLSEEHGAITDHQSEMAYHVADVGVFVVVGFVSLAIWGSASATSSSAQVYWVRSSGSQGERPSARSPRGSSSSSRARSTSATGLRSKTTRAWCATSPSSTPNSGRSTTNTS